MIGKLTGTLDHTFEGGCVLEVGGVGYVLACSARTLDALRDATPPVSALVETQVRQDSIVLHGFAAREERDAFRKLTSIQGVGPKVALDILSAMAPAALAAAIRGADRAALRGANGVGARLADRLVTELRDWAGGIQAPTGLTPAASAPGEAGPEADATSALVNLGWKRAEAERAIRAAVVRAGPAAPLDALIREGLKELGR